jgi:uncharacterized protein YdhG (YjbR/CyaY superfamily)
MQSTATDVDAYLAEVPAERRAVLTAIRDLCRANLPGYTEGMAYGMPCYTRDGEGGFAFASQKRYIALYAELGALDALRSEFGGADIGKCCIRYTQPERIDLAAVARLLQATAASDGTAC